MGITEILRRIWLFSANKMQISEYSSKQPTQLIIKLNSSLRHIIVTKGTPEQFSIPLNTLPCPKVSHRMERQFPDPGLEEELTIQEEDLFELKLFDVRIKTFRLIEYQIPIRDIKLIVKLSPAVILILLPGFPSSRS